MDADDAMAPDGKDLEFERLELALRASNEGIWDWWTDRLQISYSRRVLEFLECSGSNAPNLFLPPHDSIHSEDLPAFKRALAQALGTSGPETLAVDARVRTGGGDWRWLRMRGTVVRDRAGRALRIAGSMIDISQRKEAEAQIEEERFQLRQLIDNVPLQIYFKNLESRIVMVNQGTAEWWGFSQASELVGKHDRDIFDREHWVQAENDERHIIASGETISGKLEHETWREGGETWVVTSKFPWKDRRGNVKGTFGVSSDVTGLVTAQREAVALAAELQQRNEAYEEELLLAREIQQALATHDFPSVTGSDGRSLGFGSRYIPISGLAGDFFEVIQISKSSVGVMICDVMGHGVRSALVVAMLRGLLEKQRGQAAEPGVFLAGLNDGLSAILERAGTTMFATAFYGVLDLETGRIRYACAGHPGPIIAGPREIQQLAASRGEKGPGLGLIKGAVYPVGEHELPASGKMILFTDGVLEAENRSGEPFFEKRLEEIIGSRVDDPLDDLLDGILSSVLAFSEGQHFDDDVCLLGVSIQPGA
jgi:phosphoserine phosphatase RsbU/P